MGGESWRTIKDLKIPVPRSQGWACGVSADMYIFLSCVCFYCTAVYCLFIYLYLFSYFSKLLKLRFLTQSTLHLLILLNSEAKIFNTLFYSLIFLSC